MEEITLHQFDILKIELIQEHCKRLKILFLQSNQISVIENLKLRELRYLNLALNNIRKIENLEFCESLEKLDLTINFIQDLQSVENLKANFSLRELHLIGNPCTEIEGYREFIIGALPSLENLDGIEILKSERIKARLSHETIRNKIFAQNHGIINTINEKSLDSNLTSHTPEDRLRVAMESKKNARPDPSERFIPKEREKVRTPSFKPNGRIMQRNDLKLEYDIVDSPSYISLTCKFSKFLDTSLINLTVNPTWVSIVVKEKAFYLDIGCDIDVEKSYSERCLSSGKLLVKMRKLNMPDEQKTVKTLNGYIGGVTPILQEKQNLCNNNSKITIQKEIIEQDIDFEDDPNVPPLF